MLLDSNTLSTERKVGRKPKNPPASFGQRLRNLRTARGFTQAELAEAIGTSQRMIAYYEAQGGNVSADVIADLATALKVTVDELVLGKNGKATKKKQSPQDLRLMRKLRQVEKLPPKDRRSVLQFIDALVEKETLKKARS
jgi:transcriptional regulator with XRE-family HTH domain